MTMNPSLSPKSLLRQEIKTQLKQKNAAFKKESGKTVLRHLIPLMHGKVALFKGFSDEIDTCPLIDFLEQNHIHYFLPEPSVDDFFRRFADENIELLLVPGLAFTLHGHRLGRGKGYYDRLLSSLKSLPNPPVTVGIAMDMQILSEIPVDLHDQLVDRLCAPSLGLVTCTHP